MTNPTQRSVTVKQWASWSPVSPNLMPAAIRRHASNATNMALTTALPLMIDNPIDYVIFATQHGELQRSIGLLTDIATHTLLSPIGFTHSVHNIAVGLLAISQRMQMNTTTLSAGEHTFTMGMIEAMTWLTLNPGKTVLLTMYDDEVPSLYKDFCQGQDVPYAVALLLTTTRSEGKHLRANIVENRPMTREDVSFHVGAGLVPARTGRPQGTPLQQPARILSYDELSSAQHNQGENCFAPMQNSCDSSAQQPEALQFLTWLLNADQPSLVQPFHGRAIHWIAS